jgi:hypothetical protein
MTGRRQRARRDARLLRALALAGMLALTGCAQGDLGEISPSLARKDMHDWIGAAALAGTNTEASPLPLTADERQLRDLGYPLIAPPYRRPQAVEVAGHYGLLRADRGVEFDKTDYATHLFVDGRRTPDSMYAQLDDDVRNDSTRLPQFFETAARVEDMDAKRGKSMFYVATLTPGERDWAVRRIRENAAIVAMVRQSLAARVAAYRFALGRLVIMAPNPQAVEVERAINSLGDRLAYYRRNPPPPFAGRERSLADAR